MEAAGSATTPPRCSSHPERSVQARGVSKEAISSNCHSIESAARAAADRFEPGDRRCDSRISRISSALQESAEDEVVDLVHRSINAGPPPRPSTSRGRPASATGLRAGTARRRASKGEQSPEASAGLFQMPYEQAKAMFVGRMRGVVLQDRAAARTLFEAHAYQRQDGTRESWLNSEQFAEFIEGLTGNAVHDQDAKRFIGALTGCNTVSTGGTAMR